MAGRALIRRLSVQNFRNIEALAFDPAPRLNLLFGPNGHGKTSLIEALYVLCTTKSFRTSHLGETVQTGHAGARVAARIEALELERDQVALLGPRSRTFAVDGKKVRRHLDYAIKTPVIAFHPGDLGLCSGPSSGRRTLLSRLMLYLDPAGAEAAQAYRLALRQRQSVLARGMADAAELRAFEGVMALHGVRMARGMALVAERATAAFQTNMARMAPRTLAVEISHLQKGAVDEERFLAELSIRRPIDAKRGTATFGPHRDDLVIELDGRPARSHASQGQQRLITLGLKLAELEIVRGVTDQEPILLLDDVSSELDEERLGAVFSFLEGTQSQVFVTTTRPELFDRMGMEGTERESFRLDCGRLERAVARRADPS
jgi:DNA replication and repair protein RecF